MALIENELTWLMRERQSAVEELLRLDRTPRLTLLMPGRPPRPALTLGRLTAIHQCEARIAEIDEALDAIRSRRSAT